MEPRSDSTPMQKRCIAVHGPSGNRPQGHCTWLWTLSAPDLSTQRDSYCRTIGLQKEKQKEVIRRMGIFLKLTESISQLLEIAEHF